MNKVVIRKAASEDCARIAEIYNGYLGKATMHLEPVKTSYYKEIIKDFTNREELWVSELGNQVIGWSVCRRYSPKEGYQYACETSTFFDPNYLKKGYGKGLKMHILQRAIDLGYRYAVARIMSINTTSIQFNLSLGYRIVGEQKAIGWIDNRPYNVTIMEKDISNS